MAMRKPEHGASGDEQQRITARRRHQLTLRARESLAVDGVQRVESFNDQEVVVETDQGGMLIRGEGLHIRELNLEAGTLHVDGTVNQLLYTGDSLGKRSKGWLQKLFK